MPPGSADPTSGVPHFSPFSYAGFAMPPDEFRQRRRRTDDRLRRDREATDSSLDAERKQTNAALKAWEQSLLEVFADEDAGSRTPAGFIRQERQPDGDAPSGSPSHGTESNPARELARRIAEERRRTDEVLERERRRMDRILSHSIMLATKDALTDLVNSRGFMEVLELQLERCVQFGHTFALIYVDIDNFKQVNDVHGHVEGDEVLRRISRIMRRSVRKEDVAARLGGDEFGIVVQRLSPTGTHEIARRIIQRVRELGAEYSGTSLGASLGLVHVDCTGSEILDARAVLSRADASMYEAKATGRDMVAVALNLRGG